MALWLHLVGIPAALTPMNALLNKGPLYDRTSTEVGGPLTELKWNLRIYSHENQKRAVVSIFVYQITREAITSFVCFLFL